MRVIYRIFGLFLIITLMFSVITVSAQQTIVSKQATELLSALNIIKSDTDLGRKVTRGEFAILAAKISYPGELDELKFEPAFTDVKETDLCYQAVNYLYNNNIISGTEQKTFMPDRFIVPEHAIKILVNIMGYSFDATESGYTSVAANKGILKNVIFNDGTSFTMAEAVMMIYNVLQSDVTDTNEIDGASNGSGKDIYITKRLSIHKIKGVVTENDLTSLVRNSSLKKNEVIINDITFVNESGNDDLLGYYVQGYYKYNRITDENILLYVNTDKNSVVSFSADNLSDYKNKKYTYFNDEFDQNEQNSTLSSDFTLIYNMKALVNADLYNDDLMKPANGTITLVDNNNDGNFDVVFITSYKTYVTGSIDYDNEIIYDKNNYYPPLHLKDTNYVIKNDLGKELILKQIQAISVIYVTESLDGKYTELILSYNTINGTIEESDNEYYTISDGTYKKAMEMKQALAVGDNGIFYLTPDGKIAYYDATGEADEMMAYLINACIKNDVSKALQLKVYTENNKMLILETANKVETDGDMKTSDEALNTLDNSGTAEQLIRYKLNSKGKVMWIDTAVKGVNERDDSLQAISAFSNATEYWRKNQRSFSGKVILRSQTKVFIIPEDRDKVYVTDYNYFNSDQSYSNLSAYRLKEDYLYSDALTIKVGCMNDMSLTANVDAAYAYIVADVTSTVNSDGDEVNALTLYGNGQNLKIMTATSDTINIKLGGETYKISPGDIVKYGLNKRGEIDDGNMFLLYDLDREWSNPIGTQAYYICARKAWIYDFNDEAIQFSYKDLSNNESNGENLESYLLATFKVYVYDTKTKKVRTGNTSDMISYKDGGNGCSKVLFQVTSNYARSIFIYI